MGEKFNRLWSFATESPKDEPTEKEPAHTEIALEKIEPNPFQPRKNFSSEQLA